MVKTIIILEREKREPLVKDLSIYLSLSKHRLLLFLSPLSFFLPFFFPADRKSSAGAAKVESPARPAVVVVADSEPNPTPVIC